MLEYETHGRQGGVDRIRHRQAAQIADLAQQLEVVAPRRVQQAGLQAQVVAERPVELLQERLHHLLARPRAVHLAEQAVQAAVEELRVQASGGGVHGCRAL